MSGRIWIGTIFLLIGIAFLLNQLDVINLSQLISTWWPLILIIIGLIQLFQRKSGSLISGFLFLAFGVLFLINQWIEINIMAFFWPLLLIFIGLLIIFSKRKKPKANTDNEFECFSFFSGTEVASRAKELRSGTVTTIFGGAEIDLREATFHQGGVELDVTVIFGGVEIKVPDYVKVEFKGTPIFGGWEDKTRIVHGAPEEVKLTINSLTVFGGVEVKS